MEQTELLREVRDAAVKLEGGINTLVDGKQILAYRRFVGVRDKLLALCGAAAVPNKPEKEIENN